MLRNTSIRTKLFLAVLALSVSTLILVGVLSYLSGKTAVKQTTLEHLTSVRAGKANQIEAYFNRIRGQARIFAKDRMIIDAMAEFDAAHRTSKGVELTPEQKEAVATYYREECLPRLAANTDTEIDPAIFVPTDDSDLYLQYHYIVANPNPVGEKDLLDDAGDGSEYTAVHRTIHPILREFAHEFGFHDLFLIDGSGHIVYTVSKETDLGTNLLDGPYQDTNLARVFREAQQDALSDSVRLVDFAPYAPSFGEPASFIAAPILDGAWLLGVLVFQMPVSEIDAVMTSNRNWQTDGLGKTGETYLVGPDYRMRSNSRFLLEDLAGYLKTLERAGAPAMDVRRMRNFGTTILIQEVRTQAVAAALAGETATTATTDYRGVEVLASYAPLNIEGVDWVILSEIDADEAFARIRVFTRNLVLRMAGVLALVLVASWFLSRGFVAPIVALDRAARSFAAGEEDVEVPVTSGDELGGLAGSFNQMVSVIREKTTDLERTAEELEGVSSVILRWDTQGRVLFMNDFGLDLYGFSAEELVGQPLVGSIVPPSEMVEHNVQKMISEIAGDASKYENDETENQRKNGDRIWMAWRNTPILNDDGSLREILTIGIDITDRKTMELQIEEARDAAESANRAKSTFLANMSHELRTPMNAIIGYSEMLAEDAEEEGHKEIIPDLEKINAAGKHLLALINDILDLSKIEAGRMDLFLETFDLRQMLDEAVATVKPLITKNDNRLETQFAGDLGNVRVDLTKLRQALFNLLSNAAKFTQGGVITLAAAREARDGAEWVRLSVADTGIGIRKDKLETVFEEFSQADDSTTRDYGGTGLGLSISRRFCQMMGGDITVVSDLGEGTTFTIELPARVDALESAKTSGKSEKPEPEETTSGMRPILVVDDDPNSRDLLQRTLESEGFSVVTAATGEEGLELARELRPSLITLDILMPSMDGWSVLQEVKADPELEHIPVMMISIAGDTELGFTLGAVECLTKPVDRDKLRQLASQYAVPAGGGHALVVDDDAGIRSLFRRALTDDGWTVDEAENGAIALESAVAHRPDLVLLDLMMPVMDGFEFAIRYRELEGCEVTPIIVVTAKDLDQNEREDLLGGVERIVEKGALTKQQLLKQVRELVSQSGMSAGNENPDDA